MAGAPTIRHILCGLDGGEIGEMFQTSARTLAIPIAGKAGGGSAAGTLDLDNPMVDKLVQSTPANRLANLVKIYRDGTLLFCGDTVTAEESGTDGSTETFPWGAMGPLLTRVNTQVLGATVAGYGDGTALAQKDLGVILRDSLDAINAVWDTGVRKGATVASSNSYLARDYFKKAAEMWVELTQGAGGLDFAVEPVEPLADAFGVKIAELDTKPAIGVSRPLVILEYGSGKRNLAAYRRPYDASPGSMANVLYHLAPGFPDSIEAGLTPVITATNANTSGARRRAEIVTSDLQVNALRQLLVDEHARIRGYPRDTIFVTLTANCGYQYGVDFEAGDYVEVRIRAKGRVRFQGIVRIYNVAFTWDEFGNETLELTLINEAGQL